jgi:hypothetical protein
MRRAQQACYGLDQLLPNTPSKNATFSESYLFDEQRFRMFGGSGSGGG